MSESIRVNFVGEVWERDGSGRSSNPGWRVSVMYLDEWHVAVPVGPNPFASERDARLAMAALIAAGLDNSVACIKAGRNRVQQVAFEALPW